MHVFDLVGVFAFATFGAYQAVRHEFNTFGVVLCGFLTALGGGTVREVILNHQPAYFHNNIYLLVTLAGATFALVADHWFPVVEQGMLILDAVGLVTFAFIGAQRAGAAGFGLAPMELFAVLTACGGGILTDIVCNRRPEVCQRGSYVVVPLLTGLGYWMLRGRSNVPVWAAGFLLAMFAIRLGFIFGQRVFNAAVAALYAKAKTSSEKATSFAE